MMLDHISIGVRDGAKAGAFYQAVLAPLGFVLLKDGDHGKAFGAPNGFPHFWLNETAETSGAHPGAHIAFIAPNRPAVDAFHAAGLAAGGTCNGPPGLRPIYHPDYYAAFLFDPDGNQIEAVCHTASKKD